ncbi:MAG: hypothetical protein ABSH39_13850 [Candidatus Acidiferrum sp.]|jgi:hypothetical protein
MDETPRQTMDRVNVRLAALLEEARRALRGERDFDVRDVRRLREPVREMAPLVAQAAELKRLQPEIAGVLDQYKAQLRDLQTTLLQVRIMLQARQASLLAKRNHHTSVSRWVSALRMTR